MADTYRVGVIGRTGKGDYGHGVDVALANTPRCQVVAVADEGEEGRAKAQQRTGAATAYASYQEMLQREKLDIVAICPRWIDQHHDMILAAAHAGCHVYMEKPFCRDLLESDSAVRELEMRHLKLGIAHISQYSPVLETVLKTIDAGEIGDVLEIRGRGKEDRRGGAEDLWVLGSHIFGLMRSIGRGQPVRCTASVWTKGEPVSKKHVAAGAEGIGLLAGDHVEARYDFANGIAGHFATRKDMGGNPTRFALQVFGSRGIIEMESGYLTPAHILRDSSWSPGRTGKSWERITSAGIGLPEPRNDGTYQGGHIAAVTDLIHCIETDSRPKCSAEDCRDIIELIAAVFESHRLAGPVQLPLMNRSNPLSLLT